jgi:hypothetical protein
LVWHRKGNAFLQVLVGSWQRAKPQPRRPKSMMGGNSERGRISALRQAQQGFPKLARSVQLGPSKIKPPQPVQDWDQLGRLSNLLT